VFPASCTVLEEKTELIARRVDVLDYADVAVDLNIGWASIPFSLHVLGRRCANFVEFGSHILLLGRGIDGVIVHEDSQAFLVDADGSSDLGRFNVDLHRNAGNEGLYSALH
jgi:hypothetical protein